MNTQHNRREVLCIFGANGMGKTRYVQSLVPDWTRAIFVEGGFETEQEYTGVKVECLRDLMDYLEHNQDGIFRVRYLPTVEEFPIVCDMAAAVGSCVLVVDEADRFMRNRNLEPEFLELINRGRHFGEIDGQGVSLVCISSNPFDFPIDFRRQITTAAVFNTAEPNDVEWLAKLFGSAQREWAEKCSRLSVGEFVIWERGKGCREGRLE